MPTHEHSNRVFVTLLGYAKTAVDVTVIPWDVHRSPNNKWIGVCEPLGLTLQAETWKDLMADIGDTLDAIMKDLLASDSLPRFLRDNGWQATEPLHSAIASMH